MKIAITVLSITFLSLSAFTQIREKVRRHATEKGFMKRHLRAHSPRKMGYTVEWGENSRGCVTRWNYIAMRTGEIYVETTKEVEIHSLGKKFSITTKDRKVKLNVCNYYDEDSVVYVAVFKGDVTVNFNGWGYVLNPGLVARITDTIIVTGQSEHEIKNKIDRSWTNKKRFYQFYNKPLHIIINRIARAHGLSVQFIYKPTSLISGQIAFFKWTSIIRQINELTRYIKFGWYIDNDTLVIY